MTHTARIATILLIAALVMAFGILLRRSAELSERSRLQAAVGAAVADPAGFAKHHLTGGIGVALNTDVATGLPLIAAVAADSPAAQAGLRGTDIIVQVNGAPTAGRPLNDVVEEVRGFTGGTVTLTIQRGSTNFNCVIRRSSWKKLNESSFQSGFQ